MHFDILDTIRPEQSTPVKVALTKRTILTVKEKYEICQFKDGHPNYSHQNVADHFTTRWGKKISRRVIGDIIADRHKWSEECDEAITRNVKRFKGGKHEELEDLLELWVSEINTTDGNLTDLAITEQAKIFGQKLGILDFQYSSGWLHRFKRRRGLLARPASRPKTETPATTKYNEENNFYDDGSTLNNLSGQLYTNYGINSSSGSSVKLQSTVSIPKVDEANYPIDEMISNHQIKKETNDDTFDEFFRKPADPNEMIQPDDVTQDIVGVVDTENTVKLQDISAEEANYAVQKLKSFFSRKSCQKEIILKINDIEQELKIYL